MGYILDTTVFNHALRRAGFSSLTELARELKVHRNTLHYYLSGNSVVSSKLERAIRRLGLSLFDVVISDEEGPFMDDRVLRIVDKITSVSRELAVVLFGSRAKHKAHRYSDFDLGVYSHQGGSTECYLNLVQLVEDLSEDLPFKIDLVNLNQVEDFFLEEISQNWQFIGGSAVAWNKLRSRNFR